MKTTALMSLLAIGATSASAAAVADAEAQWCQRYGEPCWRVKRAAEAFATVLDSTPGISTRDASGDNAAADIAKRGMDSLAGVVAASQHDPRSFYSSLGLDTHFAPSKRDAEADPQWCQRYGEPCWKTKRDDIPEEKEPVSKYCWIYGNKCWKAKRDAEADPQWCQRYGEPCWKAKREAAPAPAPEAEAEPQWCQRYGEPCWKVKRAAEAVINAIHSTPEVSKREASPAPEAAAAPEYCQWMGGSCSSTVQARCNAPGGACANAKRDLNAIYNVAREITASLPQN